jgi:hypothetical protein
VFGDGPTGSEGVAGGVWGQCDWLAWDYVFESSTLLVQVNSVASLENGSIVATGFTGGDLSPHVWTASLSAAGRLIWEHKGEDVGSPSSGMSVTPTSTSDFLLTSTVGRERRWSFTAVFGRYDHERSLLWERDHAISGGGSSAQVSARSGTDRSFVLAGSRNPSETNGPHWPWLCKYTE